MKSTNLLTAQISSLVVLLLSANGLIVNSFATFLFVISSTIFIYCSMYINKHQKELLKEIGEKYDKYDNYRVILFK